MADGFLSDLLKKYASGDKEAENVLKDLKRKLDSIDTLENEASTKKPKVSEERLNCDFCSKTYKNKYTLKKHVKSHFTKLPCDICGKTFNRADILKTHLKAHKSKGDVLPQVDRASSPTVEPPSPIAGSLHIQSPAGEPSSSTSKPSHI